MRSFRLRWKDVFVAAATCFTLVSCAPQPIVYTPRPAILPLDTRADDGARVYKWVRPVTVSLTGEGAANHRASVVRQLELLETITRHRLALAEGNEADAWLVFGAPTPQAARVSHAEVFAPLYSSGTAMAADLDDDPAAMDGYCRSKWATNADSPHEIVYAVGQVPSALPEDRIERCIMILLVSALGGAEPEPPAAGEAETAQDDPPSDAAEEVVMLTVWYDNRVKPGMTVEEIKPIIAERLHRLRQAVQQRPSN